MVKSEDYKKVKDPTQNQEVDPCRFPHVNHHEKKHSSLPFDRLTNLVGLQEKALYVHNPP